MFGDNESVVMSGSVPHSQLNKRWTDLSHHRAREAVAAQVMDFWHMSHWDNQSHVLQGELTHLCLAHTAARVCASST